MTWHGICYKIPFLLTYSCSLANVIAWFLLPLNPLVLLEVVAQGMSLSSRGEGD